MGEKAARPIYKKPRRFLKVVFILTLLIAGIAVYFLLTRDAYEWTSADYKAQYKKILKEYPDTWQRITTTRLGGFTPNPTTPHEDFTGRGEVVPRLTLSEKHTGNPYGSNAENCEGYDPDVDYLRTEGGLCRVGYWIEANDGTATSRLDTFDDLWEIFNPIGDAAEAVSFVAAAADDLKVSGEGIVEGYTTEVSGGYLVQVVRKNTFGCGSHEPTKVIYKVSRTSAVAEESGDAGIVVRVAREKKPPPGSGQRLCAD